MLHPHLSAIFRKSIALPTSSGYTFFTIADILYLKADNKTAIAVVKEVLGKEGDAVKSYSVFRTLKELETALRDCGFLRIRRDILVNTMNITSFSKDGSLVLSTGDILHPSRERIKSVEVYLKRFFIL